MVSTLNAEQAEAFFDYPGSKILHQNVQNYLLSNFGTGLLGVPQTQNSPEFIARLTAQIHEAVQDNRLIGPNLPRLISSGTVNAFTNALNILPLRMRTEWEDRALGVLASECEKQTFTPYLLAHAGGLSCEDKIQKLEARITRDVDPSLIDLQSSFLAHFIDKERIADAVHAGKEHGIAKAQHEVAQKLDSMIAEDPCRFEYAAHDAPVGDPHTMLGAIATHFAHSLRDPSVDFTTNLRERVKHGTSWQEYNAAGAEEASNWQDYHATRAEENSKEFKRG